MLRTIFLACNLRHRRLARPAWTLFAFSVFYLLAVIYCRSISYRDPSSLFFDARRAYTPSYSAYRTDEANAYINAVEHSDRNGSLAVQPPLVCLGIATVARREHQYVRAAVGSLFAGLSEDERKLIFFNLLIGHIEPSIHSVFAEKWLDVVPDRLLQYSKTTPDYDQIKAWEEGGWYRNKSIYDYKYLLNDCYETGAQYVAMIEDDTLAVDGWFQRLLDALDIVQTRMQASFPEQRWIYLRLFYTDDLLGWNSEEWPTYLFWSFTFWFSLSTAMFGIKRCFPRKIEFMPTDIIATISFFCLPATIVLFFLAGKQTVMQISPGVHVMNKYGCCTQGMVYPRAVIPQILDQVRLETKGLVDMQIENVSDSGGFVRWATVPPLLQHVGATSSKGYGFDDNARQIWSFRYELYPHGS